MSRDHWCLHCGVSDDQPAKPQCTNPGWHIALPEPPPEPRLPYADDDRGEA